jgi:hypothetical protein
MSGHRGRYAAVVDACEVTGDGRAGGVWRGRWWASLLLIHLRKEHTYADAADDPVVITRARWASSYVRSGKTTMATRPGSSAA